MMIRSKKIMRCTILVLFCSVAAFSVANGAGQLCISVDEKRSIYVPFEVKSFKLSNTNVACVELTSPNMLRVTGCHNGRCDLNVQGDIDMLSQRYEISIVGETTDAWLGLERLREDLECVPEVCMEIVSNYVRVSGEVSSLKKWTYLNKVLKEQKAFPLKSSVRFIPRDPMVISGLKDKLVHDGFDVILKPFCEDGSARKMNSVNIWYDKESQKLFVRARVCSGKMWKRIFSHLNDEGAWLRFEVVNGIKIYQYRDFDGRTSLDVSIESDEE